MLKILGPIVTSKTIGESYLQLRDLFPFAKKYGFNCLVLCEPHPKSWIRFIYLSQKYKIKPIILYEASNEKFLLQDNKDIQKAIRHYNKLTDNLNLKKVDLNLPYIKYPVEGLRKICKDTESVSIKESYKYQKDLNFFSQINTFYNLNDYKIKEYQVKNQSLYNFFNQKNLSLEEKRRLNFELKTIEKLHVENYILTVKKLVDTAKKYGISIGPGRGSAVGSFLVYLLGITKVNPLKYDLLFERFLNEYRHELPDIDIDVDAEKRNELIKNLEKEIGKNRLGFIRTYATMKIKSAFKNAEKLLGYKATLEITSPIRKKENVEKAKTFSEKDKIFYTTAYYLEGLEIAESTHAAGLIISDDNLPDFLPIDRKEFLIVEWEMEDLKVLGIEKFDVLALDTLSFLRKLHAKEVYDNLNDSKNYALLSKGLTKGIFQLDSQLGKTLAKKIKPKSFEELVLLLSINRPGPLESGMIDQYLENTSPEYLKKIFSETNGVLVYQEQIMKLSQILGEFTPEESDLLRKAISKKEKDRISTFKDKFIQKASKKIGKSEAEQLFLHMENFAQYAFNKSHAAAYAHITYWLMQEKFNNTSKFFLEYIKQKGLDIDIINEAKILGVEINLPDLRYPDGVNEKYMLTLPMYCIKGIGKNIAQIFKNETFNNLEEFFNFSILKNINRSLVELIVKSGALDYLDKNRKKVLRNSTDLLKGKSQQLEEIKNILFGEKQKTSNKTVETSLEDYASYETETIGLPLTLMKQEGLSNTLIKKYLNNEKIFFSGYVYRNFLVDKSAIMLSQIYNRNLKKLRKNI